MKTAAKTLVRLALVAAVLAFAAAGPVRPALAGTPCWKTLLNDWYDGRIDRTYPVACYRDALRHLPPDVTTYSSARDDIQRELQGAIYRNHHRGKPKPKPAPAPTTDPVPTATVQHPAPAGTITAPASTTTTTTRVAPQPVPTSGDGRRQKGGFARAADRFNPGSADSFPLPLLVLATFALLLIAAGGAGALIRRRSS